MTVSRVSSSYEPASQKNTTPGPTQDAGFTNTHNPPGPKTHKNTTPHPTASLFTVGQHNSRVIRDTFT